MFMPLPKIAYKVSVRAALAAASIALVGCQTYQAKVAAARDQMKRGTPAEALKTLEPLANKEDKDQLVYLLDYGTVLQQTGSYKESAKTFSRAEKIADVQDYHSLSKVASSLLLSEEMIQYKGDDYEKVLINALNAVNYLEMGDLDEALVEVRRLNQKLYKYKYEVVSPKSEYFKRSGVIFYFEPLRTRYSYLVTLSNGGTVPLIAKVHRKKKGSHLI